MPTVRLLEHGQVTIPKKFREALGLKKGDVAEAELQGEKIVITPKKLIKGKALEKLFSLMDEVHKQNKGVREKQVTQDVLKAIAELREEGHAQAAPAKRRS